MAAKPSGCLGKLLSAAFTSVVAPVLVGVALHDLNGGAAPPVEVEPGRAGIAASPVQSEVSIPRAPVSQPAADLTPGRRPVTGRSGDWAHPVPLGR